MGAKLSRRRLLDSDNWRPRGFGLHFSRRDRPEFAHSAGQPGWTYEHGEPRAFPRSTAESGDLARWNVLGIEYSSLSDMLILPMWSPIALVTICGMLLVRGLRRQTLKADVHGLGQIRAVDNGVPHLRRMNL